MPRHAVQTRRKTVVLCAVGLSLWATATFTQGRNFTGNWVVDYARTPRGVQMRAGANGPEPADAPPPLRVALDSTSFTFGSRSYKLDGTTSFDVPNGTVTTKTSWKGDKLVLEITEPGTDGTPHSLTMTWYLEGASLVRELSSAARDGGEPRVAKIYYKRA